MPAISFSVFLHQLIERTKRQTIRLTHRLRVGDITTNYWKARLSIQRKRELGVPHFLGVSVIEDIESMTITSMDDRIAKLDGFNSFEELKEYLVSKYENKLDKQFFTTEFTVNRFRWLHEFKEEWKYFKSQDVKRIIFEHNKNRLFLQMLL